MKISRLPHHAASMKVGARHRLKMNGVASYAWATLTLQRIANRWPNSDIEALMPWNFKPIS